MTAAATSSLRALLAPAYVVRVAAALAILASAGGCGVLWELDATHLRPKIKNVAGTYTPNAATTRWMANVGHYRTVSTQIELREDGSCRFVSIPDWWVSDFGESHDGFVSGAGSWKLEKDSIHWCINLDFGHDQGRSAQLHDRYDGMVILLHQRPPYALRLGVGDPDSDEGMVYERTRAAR
jgi:hypothetical protein